MQILIGCKVDIGDRIKIVREGLDLSQGTFGERIGAVGPSISKWERGLNSPSVDVASKICITFGVNPRWLLLGTGPVFDTERQEFTPDSTEGPEHQPKPSKRSPVTVLKEGQDRSIQNRLAGQSNLEPVQGLGSGGVGEALGMLEIIAEESRQRWQIAVLSDIRQKGGGWLDEIAQRLGRSPDKVWKDIVILNRHGYLSIEPRGGGYWVAPSAKQVDISGADTVDGSSITKNVIERLILDILPKADERDGTGGVVIAEVQAADGKGLMRRFRELAHRFWAEAEASEGDADTVTFIIAAGVDPGEV